VDDHRLVRDGISSIINRQRDMVVVASGATGEEAVHLFRTYHPDVTLMDLQLSGRNGLYATREILAFDPTARIVMLSVHWGDEDIFRAIDAGAITYVHKNALADDLLRLIRQVHLGERPIGPEVQARLAERASRPTLTRREVEVMELISQGLRNKEIAASLGISDETARDHVKRILAKLDVADRSAAINVAIRRGIIHIG
jgi:two-component system NarL family response regulator